MTKKKRRPNPMRSQKEFLVVAKEDASARVDWNYPIGSNVPLSIEIRAGTTGICYGRPLGGPEYLAVEFEKEGGGCHPRVVVFPEQVTPLE